MEFVAGKGENYPRYLQWCEERHIPGECRFKEAYFHKWVGKHRPTVQRKREEHKAEVRAESIYDRQSRLRILEASLERLEAAAQALGENEKFDPGDLVRLEEQKRKTLESIAKERGEFGTKPSADSDEVAEMNRQLRSLFVNARIEGAKSTA